MGNNNVGHGRFLDKNDYIIMRTIKNSVYGDQKIFALIRGLIT